MAFTRTGTVSHDTLSGVSAADHHTATVETVHPDPSVDNEVARYDGIAGALQGYTSQAPSFSDDGILSLLSGQIGFPGAQVASADANTLDDIEEGDWEPGLQDASGDPTGEGQVYNVGNGGRYYKIGRWVLIRGRLLIDNLGTLTVSEGATLAGLPFAAANDAFNGGFTVHRASSLALPVAQDSLGITMTQNAATGTINRWSATTGINTLLISEVSAGGDIGFAGVYEAQG